MNDSVHVYSENEYGREAADHSADVINGDTACNVFLYCSSKSRRTSRKQVAKPQTSKCKNYSRSGTLHGITPNIEVAVLQGVLVQHQLQDCNPTVLVSHH